MSGNEGMHDAGETRADATADTSSAERRSAAEDIAVRLRRRGIRVNGRESGEELLGMLEAAERFETAVEAGGGDLMMDEPIGAGAPIEPDDRAFVLPQREDGESVPAFLERIAYATARARKKAR